MFGNDDYRYGGGRPKLWVAKYLESDVLPQVQYMEPTKPLGAEYFQGVAALTRLTVTGWTAYDIGVRGPLLGGLVLAGAAR